VAPMPVHQLAGRHPAGVAAWLASTPDECEAPERFVLDAY